MTSTCSWRAIDPERSWRRSSATALVDRVIAQGETKSSIVTTGGLQVDLRVIELEAWGAAHDLLHRLEGAQHPHPGDGGAQGAEAQRVRPLPRRRRARCSRPRPRKRCTSGSACRTSSRRCGRTEARSRPRSPASSPTSSPCRQIRGDLHTHTDLTDGLAPLERMLEAAAAAPLRVLRGHRPRAEPVDAAHDRREDARPARAGACPPGPVPERCGCSTAPSSTSTPTAGSTGTSASWTGSTSPWLRCTRTSGSRREQMTRRVIRAIEHPNVQHHRTPHDAQDRAPRPGRPRSRGRVRGGRHAPAPRSRSTPTPTGSICATNTCCGPGGTACSSRSTPTRTPSATST